MCACVHVRVCTIVKAVCSITDDGKWLASLWGYVWNKCDTEVLNVVPVKGRFLLLLLTKIKIKYSVTHCSGFYVNLCVCK
jgi:hypothetical protein